MEKFKHKLLAGLEVRPDFEAGEDPETGKVPTKTFKKGDVFYADEDLTLLEPNRYGVAGAPRSREKVAVPSPGATRPPGPGTAAPNGQVTDGIQQTSGTADGTARVSGLAAETAPAVTKDGVKTTVGELTGATAAKAAGTKKPAKDKVGEVTEDSREDYEAMTKADLLELAAERGVKVGSHDNKDAIIDALMADGDEE